MESFEDDLLTRRERLRAQRQVRHSAPARIRLKLPAILLLILGLACWLIISWLTSAEDERAGNHEAELPAAAALGNDAGQARPLERPEQDANVEEPESAESAVAESGSVRSGSAGSGSWEPGSVQQSPATITVHIAGAVEVPQVVELSSGGRVHDVVEAAGGLTRDAAQHGVNLAAQAVDGSLIYVPTVAELESGTAPVSGFTDGADAGAVGAPGFPGQGGAEHTPPLVNLNTSDSATLEQLPGIGPALAGRIIAHRDTHGNFSSLEELAAVSGIGPAILGNIGDLVTW